MSDEKQSMQADGGGKHKGQNAEPGVSDGGEFGGGAYPNPHTGKRLGDVGQG